MSDYSHPVVEWINGQSSVQILDWMRSRLMQRDEIWPQSLHDDEFPFQMIEGLYAREDVVPEKKFYLLDGSLKLLRESIAKGRLNDSWDYAAFANLCMLLPALVGDPVHKTEALRLLTAALPNLMTAESGINFGNEVLRTMLDLGFEAPGSIWTGYDLPSDATRGTIIFQALQRSDKLTLFSWIAEHQGSGLERLREVLSRLFRPLQRECARNLEFAKNLRIALKNLQFDSLADDITQIGIRSEHLSALLCEVNSKLSSDRRIVEIGPGETDKLVEVVFLRRFSVQVNQALSMISNLPVGYQGVRDEMMRQSVQRTAIDLLQFRSEANSVIQGKSRCML